MRSVVDRNVVMRRIPVIDTFFSSSDMWFKNCVGMRGNLWPSQKKCFWGPFMHHTRHGGTSSQNSSCFTWLRCRVLRVSVAICVCLYSSCIVCVLLMTGTILFGCEIRRERFSGRRVQSSRVTKCLPPRYLLYGLEPVVGKLSKHLKNFLRLESSGM